MTPEGNLSSHTLTIADMHLSVSGNGRLRQTGVHARPEDAGDQPVPPADPGAEGEGTLMLCICSYALSLEA